MSHSRLTCYRRVSNNNALDTPLDLSSSVGEGPAEQASENSSTMALKESIVESHVLYPPYFKDMKHNSAPSTNETNSLTTEIGSSVNMALIDPVKAFYVNIGETSCYANNVGITSTVTCEITSCTYNSCSRKCEKPFAPVSNNANYAFYIKDGCFAKTKTDSGNANADFDENGNKRKIRFYCLIHHHLLYVYQ